MSTNAKTLLSLLSDILPHSLVCGPYQEAYLITHAIVVSCIQYWEQHLISRECTPTIAETTVRLVTIPTDLMHGLLLLPDEYFQITICTFPALPNLLPPPPPTHTCAHKEIVEAEMDVELK